MSCFFTHNTAVVSNIEYNFARFSLDFSYEMLILTQVELLIFALQKKTVSLCFVNVLKFINLSIGT